MSGKLYLVATPIGNLEDMTFRAVKVLQAVDLIAAEDTRHTGKLLEHFQITTPQISYYQHNQHKRLQELLKKLELGKAIALVTDAGMPGISDPGYELVKGCIEANMEVIPIPGANAAITALVASGLVTERFVFEGFLPTKSPERKKALNRLIKENRTLIFYEAPHRLLATLMDFQEVFGQDREIVLARELTKLYEQFWRGNIGEAVALYQSKETIKGEYTLVLAGAQENGSLMLTETELKVELKQLLEQGITRSQACRQLAELTTLPRRQIYQLTLEEE